MLVTRRIAASNLHAARTEAANFSRPLHDPEMTAAMSALLGVVLFGSLRPYSYFIAIRPARAVVVH